MTRDGATPRAILTTQEPAVPRAHSPSASRLVRRVGWGVADQGISSLANFVLGVVMARTLGARDFGAFTLAFVTFSFVINAVRGPSTDPLMVRFSGRSGLEWQRAVAAATGTGMAAGAVAGAACVAVGLLLPWALGSGFVALGVCLPAIMLQDSYRFAFFSRGEAHRAFLNDLIWCVLQMVGLGALIVTHSATTWSAMLVFGISGGVAAFCGYLQLRVAPQPKRIRAWLVDHRSLGTRYLLENTSVGAARYVRMSTVGVVAGLAAVGNIRAAEMMMGPFMILLAGASQVAVPEAGHVLLKGAERLYAFVAYFSGAQALLAGLWGAVALVVLPRGLGQAMLGDVWPATRPLLLPVIIALGLTCVQTSITAAIRALGASRRSLSAQLFAATTFVLLGVGGAAIGDALGSCWGVVLATFLGLGMWIWQLKRAVDEHVHVADSEDVA